MVYVYIGIMALVTYLIRVIPLTVFHRKIETGMCSPFCTMCPIPA